MVESTSIRILKRRSGRRDWLKCRVSMLLPSAESRACLTNRTGVEFKWSLFHRRRQPTQNVISEGSRGRRIRHITQCRPKRLPTSIPRILTLIWSLCRDESKQDDCHLQRTVGKTSNWGIKRNTSHYSSRYPSLRCLGITKHASAQHTCCSCDFNVSGAPAENTSHGV
jgi:hypothetical protein